MLSLCFRGIFLIFCLTSFSNDYIIIISHREYKSTEDDMARAFSEEEKVKIKESLLDCAAELIGRQGVQKTTVDEIAKKNGMCNPNMLYPGTRLYI